MITFLQFPLSSVLFSSNHKSDLFSRVCYFVFLKNNCPTIPVLVPGVHQHSVPYCYTLQNDHQDKLSYQLSPQNYITLLLIILPHCTFNTVTHFIIRTGVHLTPLFFSHAPTTHLSGNHPCVPYFPHNQMSLKMRKKKVRIFGIFLWVLKKKRIASYMVVLFFTFWEILHTVFFIVAVPI